MAMLRLPLRRLGSAWALATPVALAALLAGACQGTSDGLTAELALELGRGYVQDPALRRALLEQSLVSRTNGYARRRLEKYDEEHWGSLEVHDPAVRPVTRGDLGTWGVGQGPPVD